MIKNKINNDYFLFLFAFFLLPFAFSPVAGQQEDLPDKIRGYKVHQARVTVKSQDERPANPEDREKNEAFINIGEPELSSAGLTGIVFEISAEIEVVDQSGTVDFLTFKDFQVNGLDVNIEEYQNSFDFKKNELFSLPQPIRIRLGATQTLFGAAKELGDSKEEWRVTGRVFVFGRFRKSGFNFKRVIPVDIDVWIKNPVRNR